MADADILRVGGGEDGDVSSRKGLDIMHYHADLTQEKYHPFHGGDMAVEDVEDNAAMIVFVPSSSSSSSNHFSVDGDMLHGEDKVKHNQIEELWYLVRIFQ